MRARPAARPAPSFLTRRTLLRSGLLAGAGLVGAPMLGFGRCRLFAQGPVVSTRAFDLVVESTVIDMLGLLTLDWPRLRRWMSEPASFDEPQYRQLEASGINLFHPAVETSARDPHEGARRWLAGWNALLSSRPCFLAPVSSMADLLEARRLGKIAVLVGFQNSSHFRTASDVGLFWSLGQRVSQLTYDARNALGSGAREPRDRGLTPFGAEVVAAMNRVGMVVDISHCGERTSREAIAASREPVLVTHANCRALAPHPRNKSDAIIRLMAAGGGVMGITLVRAFVGASSPTLQDVLSHFDHVARLVGVEHVGLGSDVDLEAIDAASGRPLAVYQIRGMTPGRRVFQLADGLLRRGYSEASVRLVLGGNFARALGDIWARLPWPTQAAPPPRRDPFCPAPNPRGITA